MTEITQADHDAAVDWYSPRESEWTGLLAAAFARHREQAEQETVAKIVTWLRGNFGSWNVEATNAKKFADAIEAKWGKL